MTPEQAVLVKESWAKVAPVQDKAAELFYDKLFEMDPELKVRFKGDMTEQGQKLVKMINTVVNGLDHLEGVVPAVQELGKRHVGYGVKDQDYNTFGVALLWTLEAGLGDALTDDVKDAWITVYGVLASTMKAAAHNTLSGGQRHS